jgi:hypothetical protein
MIHELEADGLGDAATLIHHAVLSVLNQPSPIAI